MNEEHPNLINVFDSGITANDEPFYIMPLAASTLRSILRNDIEIDKLLPLFSQILDGVEAAHLKGVTHRDLKPENILVDATSGLLKVADFGIARFGEDELHTLVETSPHDRLANFEYAAPEQRRTGLVVGHRADIYALGLILAEMYTKEVPHGADPVTIASVAPDYAYLDEISNSMRQNSPDKRPASIAAIKNLLIARGNEFVQQQKLDALRKTVIPIGVMSDALINNPIALEDVDYENGYLIFTISQSPNGKWLHHFHNMGSFGAIMGSGPEYFNFNRNKASVPVTESAAQMVVNHFKNYLQRTNMLYAHDVKAQLVQEEQEARRQLQEAIQRATKEQEARKRMKSGLTW